MNAPVLVDGNPIHYVGLPVHLREGMRRYLEERVRPGNTLMAILCNDLMGAVLRISIENMVDLPEIIRWVHWNSPHDCHGSRERVTAWLAKRDEITTENI